MADNYGFYSIENLKKVEKALRVGGIKPHKCCCYELAIDYISDCKMICKGFERGEYDLKGAYDEIYKCRDHYTKGYHRIINSKELEEFQRDVMYQLTRIGVGKKSFE